MNAFARCLTLLCLPLCAAGATAFSTDPVGVVAYAPLPASDSVYSLPIHRTPVFEGVVTGYSAGTLSISAAGWTTGNFVYGSGDIPTNTYYLLVISGDAEGTHYKITANTADTLALETADGDLSASIAAGNRVQIVPYWTLGTLFSSGAGVTPSASHAVRKTQIQLFSASTSGVNQSAATVYYYFGGTNPGWRKVGGGTSTLFDDQLVEPDSFFIYRETTSTSNTFEVTGNVQMCRAAVRVATLEADSAQDNYVAFTVAKPMSLSQSRLVESGAFAASTSHASRTDQLFVFDNTAAGMNKSAVAVYYYFSGTNPGWRKVGGGVSNILDDTLVFQPGNGYLIRKAATTEPQSVVVRTEVPSYLTTE